jgi:hypothetical protein
VEGKGVVALSLVAAALVAFVPVFNSLNTEKLGNAKPPLDLKHPPPHIDPPPMQPPPVGISCTPHRIEWVNKSFPDSSGVPTATSTFPIDIRNGTRELVVGIAWRGYQGQATVSLQSPNGTSTTVGQADYQTTLLSAKSGIDGMTLNGTALAPGSWSLSVGEQAVTGSFQVAADTVGCYTGASLAGGPASAALLPPASSSPSSSPSSASSGPSAAPDRSSQTLSAGTDSERAFP